MTVIVANDTPPAIRGLLKRWFVEPKPNVFVGSVNQKTRQKTLEYVMRNAPELGLLVLSSARNSQGFCISMHGATNRRVASIGGHYLIAEKWPDGEPSEEDEVRGY
jgi:CRISPR-associated protein Cas2